MSRAREFADLAGSADAGGLTGRNLIINGAMLVAQRGTSFTGVTASAFHLDRFEWQTSLGPTVSVEQSSDAPSGFSKSLKLTVTATDTMDAADYDAIHHPVEGLNCSQLNFGASTAKQITLSFWVKSSVTGTYAVNFINASNTRTWTSSYSISSANTWEYKTMTVDGDTAGTWLTTNGIGLKVWFSLGSGSNYNPASPSTAWTAGLNLGLDGTVDLRTTNGATFYLTGIQLELGDTATPFEHRSYGDELARCQRYYFKTENNEHSVHANRSYNNGNQYYGTITFPTTMRAAPSFSQQTNNINLPSIANTTATFGNYTLRPGYCVVQITPASDYGSYTYTVIAINNAMKFDAEL